MQGIVLLIDDSELSRIVYHALSHKFDIAAVIMEEKVPRSTFLKRRLKKLGLRIVAGQIFFAKCIVPLLRRESAHRQAEILRQFAMNPSAIPQERITHVHSVNNEQTKTILRGISPALVVVNGTRILEEPVLQATDAVFLNIHVGITPLYRGVHGGYWAMDANDPAHFGVTVHKIDTGIDTGAIIAQAATTPSMKDNFASYPLLQIALALPLLQHAVQDALNGTLRTTSPPEGKSRLWTHPTAFYYLWRRLTKGIR